METYGTIHIKLNELLMEEGISKSKLSHRAKMQQTQINNHCNNKLTRLDTDILTGICSALNCKISDLLESISLESK